MVLPLAARFGTMAPNPCNTSSWPPKLPTEYERFARSGKTNKCLSRRHEARCLAMDASSAHIRSLAQRGRLLAVPSSRREISGGISQPGRQDKFRLAIDKSS